MIATTINISISVNPRWRVDAVNGTGVSMPLAGAIGMPLELAVWFTGAREFAGRRASFWYMG